MVRFSRYFNMVRLYITALILTFYQVSNAELTSSDQTQVDEIEASELSTGVYSENNCASIETQFQNYVMNIMDSAISTSSKSYHCLMGGVRNNSPDCKKLNSMNLGNLKKYRRSLKRVYQEMANDWVREESKQDPRFKACLGLPVQFERNIRRVKLKVKPDIPGHSCQPIITRWSHGLDQLTQEYLDGKRTITSLNSEEIASLKAFHHSPLKRIISTNALFDSRLTDSELKQKLASAYNAIRIGTEKLKKKVSKLKDREKYILFDFQNQFTAFTNTLPSQTRPKATRCIKSSGFFRDCTINALNQGSRCGSRIWGLGKEMLPVIPLIDSIKGMGNVMAAEASGVMTSSEATQKRAELATLGILGLGGIAGGASIVRSAVKAGGPKITRKQVSSRVKTTTRLERMGVDYSVSGIDSYAVNKAQVRGVLEIRRGATQGRRHTNPRGLALKHKDIDARIKEAEEMGVKVVVDTSLGRVKNVNSYYSPQRRMIAINSDSDWIAFESEFQHALFHKYVVGHNFEVPTHVISKISKSDRSLSKVRERLPDTITRNWSREEQNVIIRYMRDDIPNSSLDERLSVNRELELLGWRRYLPSGLRTNVRSTQNLVNELNAPGSLTARRRSIRNQAYINHHAQTYGADAAVLAGTAGLVGADLTQKENSFLSNLPKNIRSAIQSAEEVLYSERGILIKDQNGQAQFFSVRK